ncbi:hypothetical protein [Mesorhizobium sp. BHbdii]
MAVNELLFAAFQRPLPYPAAKMKLSQMKLSQRVADGDGKARPRGSPFARPKML